MEAQLLDQFCSSISTNTTKSTPFKKKSKSLYFTQFTRRVLYLRNRKPPFPTPGFVSSGRRSARLLICVTLHHVPMCLLVGSSKSQYPSAINNKNNFKTDQKIIEIRKSTPVKNQNLTCSFKLTSTRRSSLSLLGIEIGGKDPADRSAVMGNLFDVTLIGSE